MKKYPFGIISKVVTQPSFYTVQYWMLVSSDGAALTVVNNLYSKHLNVANILKKCYYFNVDEPLDVPYVQVLRVLYHNDPLTYKIMNIIPFVSTYNYVVNCPYRVVEIVELNRDDFFVALAPWLF